MSIHIPDRDLEIHFLRSAGPGGQNVNKVATAVQLRFDLAGTQLLDAASKARMRRLAGQRLTAEGVVLIVARTHRTQVANRRDALARLTALIEQARIAPKPRRATKPTFGSQQRRMDQKRAHQNTKVLRRKVGQD